MPPQWTGLGRTTKLGPFRNHKGHSILEFIKCHNPCPKELVYFVDQLAEHEKNKLSKNAKISRNIISLITPKGVHNYTTDAYDQAIILQQLHNPARLKTEPKKEEKVEEKNLRKKRTWKKKIRKKKKKMLRKKI